MLLKMHIHNPNESIFLAAECEMLCDARSSIATIPKELAEIFMRVHVHVCAYFLSFLFFGTFFGPNAYSICSMDVVKDHGPHAISKFVVSYEHVRVKSVRNCRCRRRRHRRLLIRPYLYR